jgi:hypothetical protein
MAHHVGDEQDLQVVGHRLILLEKEKGALAGLPL